MTFIASVIAKEGVAIIADSLVTTSQPTLDYFTFQDYIKKATKEGEETIVLDPKEIAKLFKVKPTHTKDFEDKLYKFDKFTAITTAGSASINNKRIKKLISDAIKLINPDTKTNRNNEKQISEKVEGLKAFIFTEVKKFLRKNPRISETIFLVTFYSPASNKTLIYKITVNSAEQKELQNENFEFISVVIQPEQFKVVCDGQNRLAERLLFGDFNGLFEVIPRIVKKIAKDFSLPEAEVGNDYWIQLFSDKNIFNEQMINDMKIYRLTELSLQQAVDLASLLMRIEIDIQKYTENIPTVGGVIKLAVIDNEGFRFIAGNEIVKHENF